LIFRAIISGLLSDVVGNGNLRNRYADAQRRGRKGTAIHSLFFILYYLLIFNIKYYIFVFFPAQVPPVLAGGKADTDLRTLCRHQRRGGRAREALLPRTPIRSRKGIFFFFSFFPLTKLK
jgi:hypothetical protein